MFQKGGGERTVAPPPRYAYDHQHHNDIFDSLYDSHCSLLSRVCCQLVYKSVISKEWSSNMVWKPWLLSCLYLDTLILLSRTYGPLVWTPCWFWADSSRDRHSWKFTCSCRYDILLWTSNLAPVQHLYNRPLPSLFLFKFSHIPLNRQLVKDCPCCLAL